MSQRLVDVGLAEWNGQKPELHEPVALQREDIVASDIIVEMREG
jgi:hypothetical protein